MRAIDSPKRIIISRTDSIGDVCLTLPICKALKEKFSNLHIIFLGRTYTEAIINSCPFVDEFLNYDALAILSDSEAADALKKLEVDTIIHVFPNKKIASWAKSAGIKNRVGTSHRIFHWFTCNIRPSFTRKNSDLHEAQLNFELLNQFGFNVPAFEEIKSWRVLESKSKLPLEIEALLNNQGRVILHAKSQGSAVEWGIPNFMTLASKLAERNVQVFFTGTLAEGELFKSQIPNHENIVDLTGKLSLNELIAFIQKCDVLVAASTGPLHIAGLLGIKAVGLFSSRRPIHPGRWAALGEQSIAVVKDVHCRKCAQGELCTCIAEINPDDIIEHCL